MEQGTNQERPRLRPIDGGSARVEAASTQTELAQARKKANRGSARRIVENELEEVLSRAEECVTAALDLRGFLAMAQFAEATEEEGRIRLMLTRLAAAAAA